MAMQTYINDRTMRLMGSGKVFKVRGPRTRALHGPAAPRARAPTAQHAPPPPTTHRARPPPRPPQDNTARINSLDFHRSEDLLVTGGDDDCINFYNTASGMKLESLQSRKYGVSNICFTHSQHCAMYATSKVRGLGGRAGVGGGGAHVRVRVCRACAHACVCVHDVAQAGHVCTAAQPPARPLAAAAAPPHTHTRARAPSRAPSQPPLHSQDANWYALRYHDLRRNEYLRYFRGHTAPLNTLAMSPKSDVFMSAAQVGGRRACPCCLNPVTMKMKAFQLDSQTLPEAGARPRWLCARGREWWRGLCVCVGQRRGGALGAGSGVRGCAGWSRGACTH